MSTFKIPTIFSAVDKLSAPLKRMRANMSSFANKSAAGIGRLDRGLRKLTPSLGGMGKQMLAFASTGALIAGIGGAINIVKDYEQANADLAAVMRSSGAEQKLLATDAERLGSITAKSATEVVGLQEAYARLGFPTEDIINMTEATISGSIAMNSELAATAELTGAVVNSFDAFSSTDTPAILDKMTLATQKSALNFEKLNSALPNVAGAANAAGVGFDELLGLLGKLSDAGIDASASGTALKNIFIKAAQKGSSYGEILEDISNSSDKLTASVDATGKIAAVSANILAANLSGTAKLTDELKAGFDGAAKSAADKRLQTFGGSITLLQSAYEGLILDINKSTGAMGGFKNIIDFVTKNIKGIAIVIGSLVGAFIGLKLAVLGGQAALFVYNTALGINAALSKGSAMALRGNELAMKAYKVGAYASAAASWVMNGGLMAASTAAWAFTAALLANPLTWIVIAIVALIAALVALVVYWEDIVKWVTESDSVFAKLIRVALLPIILIFKAIGWVIGSTIDMFAALVEWVQTSDSAFAGFIRGTLSSIGQYFTDIGTGIGIVVDGLASLWDWLSNFTTDALAPLMSVIDMFSDMAQDEMGVDVNKNITGELETVNPDAVKQESLSKSITENTEKQELDLNVNVTGQGAEVTSGGSANNVNLKSTMTGGQ